MPKENLQNICTETLINNKAEDVLTLDIDGISSLLMQLLLQLLIQIDMLNLYQRNWLNQLRQVEKVFWGLREKLSLAGYW